LKLNDKIACSEKITIRAIGRADFGLEILFMFGGLKPASNIRRHTKWQSAQIFSLNRALLAGALNIVPRNVAGMENRIRQPGRRNGDDQNRYVGANPKARSKRLT
jgi:hypothetical protein